MNILTINNMRHSFALNPPWAKWKHDKYLRRLSIVVVSYSVNLTAH